MSILEGLQPIAMLITSQNCRGHSGIQRCQHPPFNRSTIRLGCYHHIFELLARRYEQMVHHNPSMYLANAGLDRTGERFFHITVPLCFAVFAYILAAATTKTAPRYVAMMLMVPGVYTGYVVALAWISNSLPRPPAKRAAALAFINAISNCSSIYASYMYSPSAGKLYVLSLRLRD